MMAVEQPFLIAIIARQSDPKINIAAFAIAFSIATAIELIIIIVVLTITILSLNLMGVFAASLAFIIGKAAANLYLAPPHMKASQEWSHYSK